MITKAFHKWWEEYWTVPHASELVKSTAFIAFVDGYYLKNQQKHYNSVIKNLTYDAWIAGREYLIQHESQPI